MIKQTHVKYLWASKKLRFFFVLQDANPFFFDGRSEPRRHRGMRGGRRSRYLSPIHQLSQLNLLSELRNHLPPNSCESQFWVLVRGFKKKRGGGSCLDFEINPFNSKSD